MSKQRNAGNLLPAREEKSNELKNQEARFFEAFGFYPIFDVKDEIDPINKFSAEVSNVTRLPSKEFGTTKERAKIASLISILQLSRDE